MKYHLLKAASVALVTCLGLTAASYAAQATASVNVRLGPSTGYAIVDTLYAGEPLTIYECTTGWCLIAHSGPDGWVSSRYLSNTSSGGSIVVRPPSVSLSFQFGNGNGFPGNGNGGNNGGGNNDLVCLVTFERADQVAGGADADVVRAQVMPRARAMQLDGPNDRRGIFDYGSNQQTRDTCDYLDDLN